MELGVEQFIKLFSLILECASNVKQIQFTNLRTKENFARHVLPNGFRKSFFIQLENLR